MILSEDNLNSPLDELSSAFGRKGAEPNEIIPDISQPLPPTDSKYEALTFATSLDFLAFFDPNVRNQSFHLHKWQIEVNEDISLGRTRIKGEVYKERKPDSKHPYKFCLCAANGSGKDAFVIAPLALWFICCKIQAKVIITSSSGAQLTTQTEHYIATLAREINNWHVKLFGKEILKVNKRHIECLKSGSVIHMFATDEGEKAEGHHPTAPGCEMMLIVNEAKSVSPIIFDALRRCTGFNYWINVSSPGEPIGHFYKAWESWPNRRRVTYFDCPHQSPEEFEQDRIELGEYSALFRSKWLALFTFLGGRYVIPQAKLETLRSKIKANLVKAILSTRPIRIGIDIALSENGDETVISVWQGNKQLAQYTMRIQDSTVLAEHISKHLLNHVSISHPHIYADDGGVGRSVIDILNRRGFKINRVLNNAKAKDTKRYKNRGAQSWYKVARLVEEGAIIPLEDDRLFSQLASRKYKESDAGIDKMTLEPKKAMISQGLPSPDRADAMVLAFTDANIEEFLRGIEEAERPIKREDLLFDASNIKEEFRRNRLNGQMPQGKRRIHSSISCI